LDSPNRRYRVWGLLLLATHQKAASPLPASDLAVSEAPLCIIQHLLRRIRVHHLNQHLRFATRCGEGIRPLHPTREASRPPSPARRQDRKGWPPSPLSRLGPLQTECHIPPRDSASGYGPIVSITSFLQKTSNRENRWNGFDPQKGTVCYSGPIYSHHPVSPMLPPLSSTCRPAA
jgi:hypothetical protein